MLRRGVWFVLLYHFAGYTRVIGPTASGLLRMPYRRWAPFDYGGAVLWIFGYFGAGYALGVLGVTLDSTDKYFRYLEWIILGLFSVWVYFMIKRHEQEIMERLGLADAKPEDAAAAAGAEDET